MSVTHNQEMSKRLASLLAGDVLYQRMYGDQYRPVMSIPFGSPSLTMTGEPMRIPPIPLSKAQSALFFEIVGSVVRGEQWKLLEDHPRTEWRPVVDRRDRRKDLWIRRVA